MIKASLKWKYGKISDSMFAYIEITDTKENAIFELIVPENQYSKIGDDRMGSYLELITRLVNQ